MRHRGELTDQEWERLSPLLPPEKPETGRTNKDHRQVIDGILWRERTGAPWRDLPEARGLWSSVCHRWRRGCLRGWWEVVFEALRPSLPAEGLLLDSTTCKAQRAASGAAGSMAAAEAGSAPSRTPAPTARAGSCG